MRGPRAPFNPFIVLSDVTISTMVVLASLLMIFSQMVGRQALLDRQREQAAFRIKKSQEDLAQMRPRWPRYITMLEARGLASYLFRFPEDMFDQQDPGRLSAKGRHALAMWGRLYAGKLRQLQGHGIPLAPPPSPSPAGKYTDPGNLVEIQVQAHCRQGIPDAQAVTIRRAQEAAGILCGAPGFPRHLVSVSAHSWYRCAFEPSEEARRKNKQRKAPLPDRVDILLVFAGHEEDHNYVASRDGRVLYGRVNDQSTSVLSAPGADSQ